MLALLGSRFRFVALALCAVLSACTVAEVTDVAIRGWVIESRESTEERMSAGDVCAYSRDGAEVLGCSVTLDSGYFSIAGLPKMAPLTLVAGKADAEDPHAYGVAAGYTQETDLLLFLGSVVSLTLEQVDAVLAIYSGALGASTVVTDQAVDLSASGNGGFALGRIGHWDNSTGDFHFDDRSGVSLEVVDQPDAAICFHGDLPESEDEEQEGAADCSRATTGTDARFAIFGLAPGLATINVIQDGGVVATDDVLVVEDGVTFLDFFNIP